MEVDLLFGKNMKSYKIKKGKHSSGLHFGPFFTNKISFSAEFSESCIYNLGNSDQFDINKLIGFSNGFHHKNSARIGWRAKGEQIEIVTYCYVDGVRIREEIMGLVAPGEKFFCVIKEIGDLWVLQFQSLSHFSKFYVKRGKQTFWGYKLYPYFGGNNVAPHNMEIKIQIQK